MLRPDPRPLQMLGAALIAIRYASTCRSLITTR
jgi:hypothetical protein